MIFAYCSLKSGFQATISLNFLSRVIIIIANFTLKGDLK